MSIPHILKAVQNTPWAMRQQELRVFAEVVANRAYGIKFTSAQISQRLAASRAAAAARPKANDSGAVAVIAVHGVLVNRAGAFDEVSGMVGAESISAQLRAAVASPDIKAIVFDIDSPGGMVSGIPELADEIANCGKYTVGVANQLMASAAYWIGSQCDELVVSPSAEAGSIGVVSIHEDLSQALEASGVKVNIIRSTPQKYEGNPYEPLTDEAKADIQAGVNAYYEMFIKSVSTGRGVSMAKVKSDFGSGRTLMAKDAVAAGMADRVDSIRNVIKGLGGSVIPMKRNNALAGLGLNASDANLPDNAAAKAQHDYLRLGGKLPSPGKP